MGICLKRMSIDTPSTMKKQMLEAKEFLGACAFQSGWGCHVSKNLRMQSLQEDHVANRQNYDLDIMA